MAGGLEIQVFQAGGLVEFGEAEPGGQPPVVAFGDFAVDQER